MGCEIYTRVKCLSDCSVIAIYFFFISADAVGEIRTMLADIVRRVHEFVGLVLDSLLYLRHIAAECRAVSLAAKAGNAHQMVVAYPHHLTNLFSRFVSSAAMIIFTASKGMNGNTHHPRMVTRLAGSLLFAYTNANHAVPNA